MKWMRRITAYHSVSQRITAYHSVSQQPGGKTPGKRLAQHPGAGPAPRQVGNIGKYQPRLDGFPRVYYFPDLLDLSQVCALPDLQVDLLVYIQAGKAKTSVDEEMKQPLVSRPQ